MWRDRPNHVHLAPNVGVKRRQLSCAFFCLLRPVSVGFLLRVADGLQHRLIWPSLRLGTFFLWHLKATQVIILN